MSESTCVARNQVFPVGAPSLKTRLRVANLAITAADVAMTVACRIRSRAVACLEAVVHASHKEAVEAERYAEQYIDDPAMQQCLGLLCP